MPGQPRSAPVLLGQLNQLPQVRHPQASWPDLRASTGYLPTNAMPTLWWLPTLYVPKPFLWLCFWLRELALLPSHGHGYSSIALDPTSPGGLPFIGWMHPDAVLFLQDPILSPLCAIVFMFLDDGIHLPWPGSPSLFSISKPHVIIMQKPFILFPLHRSADNVLCFPPAKCPAGT